jgi:hypothetical protein
MRDLNISIEGSWWDTLLYKGNLHALTPEGDWAVYDWDALTSDLEAAVEEAARPSLRFAFRASNAIENGALSRQVVTESFRNMTTQDFSISSKQLAKYLLVESDVSDAFPSTSMNMHYDRMIMSSQNGVHVEYVNSDQPGKHSLKKICSIATRQIAAKYGKIACASGDAGLRQLDLHLEQGFKPAESEGFELNSASCDACDWMYQNISATSYRGGSYLANFKRTGEKFQPKKKENATNDEEGTEIEKFEFSGSTVLTDGIEDDNPKLDHAISWGSNDKIYKVSGKTLRAFRFLASGKRPQLGDIELPGCTSEIVSVRSALLGVIVEFDEAVVVVKGDGSLSEFDGEPVNIATFPNSRSYENQLHLIMEDRVQVKSLNQNFESEGFWDKKFGTTAPKSWFGSSD